MSRWISAMAGVAAMVLTGPVMAAGMDDFVGEWEAEGGNSIARISIENAGGGQVNVHGWGKCSPNPCDWGEVSGAAFASNAGGNVESGAKAVLAVFDAGFSRTTVLLTPQGNKLDARLLTEFTDGSGRTNYTVTQKLRRALIVAPLPGGGGAGPLPFPFPFPIPLPTPGGGGGGGASSDEDCVSFTNANLQVKNIGGRWKVVDGSHWIIDTGSNKPEAYEALEVLQHYNANQYCFVGRPQPGMSYLKRNNTVPVGAKPGEDCIAFDRTSLEVSNAGGLWRIIEGGSHAMFAFERAAEANEALDIIQRYGFRFSCFVGRPDPSMAYLRR